MAPIILNSFDALMVQLDDILVSLYPNPIMGLFAICTISNIVINIILQQLKKNESLPIAKQKNKEKLTNVIADKIAGKIYKLASITGNFV